MQTAVKTTDWLFPNEDIIVTDNDFKNMVNDAEHSGDMTFEQFKISMSKWVKQNG
ncbi:MAG: hypothetical protein LBV75_01625 [Paludibacter sp.]|jgi:uncharacterized Zn finger protein|nr:hypothetical protein [Paludibacter sp.]